jgi:hypothetical protein
MRLLSIALILLCLAGAGSFTPARAADPNPADARADTTCILFTNLALDPPTTYSIILETRDPQISDVSLDAYTLDTTYTFRARPAWFEQGDPANKTGVRASTPIELFDPSSKPFLFFTARAGGERESCQTYIVANDWDTKAWRASSRVPDGALTPKLTKAEGKPACSDPFAPVRLVDKALPKLLPSDPSSQKPWHVSVRVIVDEHGAVTGAEVFRTDASPQITNAVTEAARASKYSPQLVRCIPIAGGYIFRLQG